MAYGNGSGSVGPGIFIPNATPRSSQQQTNAAYGHSALGTAPAASTYKPFLATVASDPFQGAIPALRTLQLNRTGEHGDVDVKRLVLVAGFAATLVLAVGCDSSTQGQPNPATNPGQGQPITGAPTSPPSDGGGQGSGLPVNNPCQLVPSDALSQLSVTAQPTTEMVGTAHVCNMNSADFAMGVAIRTDVGLAGFNSSGGTVHDTTVGSHQAKQEVGVTGSCVIGIGVSATSRVDITVTGDGTTDPCPTAMKLASLVEPKLP
jgi:hypothetical protein